MYFKAGEDARAVVSRELAIAGLAQAHLQQITPALRDIFLGNRREKAYPERVGKRAKRGNAQEQGRWRDYVKIFASQAGLINLRALQSEAQTLSLQLAQEKEAFYQQFQADQVISYDDRLVHDKAEASFSTRETAINESFWIGIEKDQPSSSSFPASIAIPSNEFEQNLTIYIGILKKRHIKLTILLRNDMFLEQLQSDAVASEYRCLEHSENVYTAEMTALCVPLSVQEGNCSVLPELIRKCEESPELHFPPIRKQIEAFATLNKENMIGFTRHSNIGQARGVFHLVHFEAFRLLLPYCDRNYINCLILPICEWLGDSEAQEITANLLSLLKQALVDCSEGDLKTVVLVLDTDVEDCKALVNTIGALFAEELLPEIRLSKS
jgi:hypothetical protein